MIDKTIWGLPKGHVAEQKEGSECERNHLENR